MMIEETGGKGYFLHRMKKGGFPVPDFIPIGYTNLQDLFSPRGSEGLFQKIHATTEKVRDISELSRRIQKVILEAPIDQIGLEEIQRACESHFGPGYRAAVRSSAMDEDGAVHSFAGQHKTLLFVDEAGIEHAIRSCLASAWSHSALSYRQSSALSIGQFQFALVVQKMVDAERSGVAFSMDVTGNLSDAVISSGYGLGEGIVNGQVETDTYLVNRVSNSRRRILNPKLSQVRWKKGKTEILAVGERLREKASLADEEVMQVYDWLIKAEKLLGKPADMEFSFDAAGKLHILQVRPVTAVHLNQLGILDNTNIVESYPGITLPLSFTFAARAYESIFRNCARLFQVEPGDLENQGVFQNLIGHFKGRVYYRLDHWYRMTFRVYNSRSALKAWEEAVGLPDSRADDPHFRWIDQFKMSLVVLGLVINYRRNNRRFFEKFQKEYELFRSFNQFNNSASELWEFFEERVDRSLKIWPYTIVNDFLAFKFFGWLQSLIRKWKIADDPDMANGLVSGYGEVWSEQALRSMLDLKVTIRTSNTLMKIFRDEPAVILSRLGTEPESGHQDITGLNKAIETHIEEFGDRTLAELKLETVSPRMQPVLLIDLLKSQLNSSLTREELEQRQRQGREMAWQAVRLRIPSWHPHYLILKGIARLAAYGVRSRENMRFCRAKMFAVSREVFLALGAMMVKADLLKEVRDIFYLKQHEVQAFGEGKQVDCRPIVDRRKKVYAGYHAVYLPDRIVYDTRYEPVIRSELTSRAHTSNDGIMQGTPVSRGMVEGEALVITEPVLTADVRGKILVTRMTDPGWVFLMSQATALVAEKGSILSHTAIVGRELGLPVIVGVQEVTSKVKTGDRLRLDGSTGSLEIVRGSNADQ